MAKAKRRSRNQRPSWWVVVVGITGVLLIGVACASLWVNKPWEVTAGFLGVGAILLFLAAFLALFHRDMEGTQTIKFPGGVEATLNLRKIQEAEAELDRGAGKPLPRDN